MLSQVHYHGSMTPLVLASTSSYRKQLISQLGLVFKAQAPRCDEDTFKAKIQDPRQLAETLAWEKAHSLANQNNCVIGGDQVVDQNGQILGKTGSAEKACEQLWNMQGKSHRLITALNVIYKGKAYPMIDITLMKMRPLSQTQIEKYVQIDQPLDCAGSYKFEKSGILLFESVTCQDASAIQGVPMIQLTNLLFELGFPILVESQSAEKKESR